MSYLVAEPGLWSNDLFWYVVWGYLEEVHKDSQEAGGTKR